MRVCTDRHIQTRRALEQSAFPLIDHLRIRLIQLEFQFNHFGDQFKPERSAARGHPDTGTKAMT